LLDKQPEAGQDHEHGPNDQALPANAAVLAQRAEAVAPPLPADPDPEHAVHEAVLHAADPVLLDPATKRDAGDKDRETDREAGVEG